LRARILAGFVLLLSLLSNLGCIFVFYQEKREGIVEIREGRVLDILEYVKQRADIVEEIRLYTYVSRYNNLGYLNPDYSKNGDGIFRDRSGTVKIFFRQEILEHFPYRALQGIIAHEIGHLVAGHVDSEKRWPDLTNEEIETRQKEADDFAIKIYGQDSVDVFKKSYSEIFYHDAEPSQ